MTAAAKRDYSLIGRDARLAVEQGLAAAEWYHTEIPRKRMKELMRRRDWPALRDTAIWFALLASFGFAGYWFWGSWECVLFFAGYGVLYASASDSRWHETGHGTAFRTAWLNDALHQIASFMTLREPTVWRWSHARHHTDTIIVGRDREIDAMRPPDVFRLALNFFAVRATFDTLVSVARHSAGRLSAEELTFIPESEHRRVIREARAWVAVYLAVIGAAIYSGSVLPLMYVGLPNLYGTWLNQLLALTQHAGLAENVLDHRLNSRTVYMNPVVRFIYWNMNYHVEHHMFPMVPYHALPKLHAELLHDMPAPCKSILAAYREILPVVFRQLRNPECYIKRELPPSAKPFRPTLHRVVVEH
jgi:fatty acid desaturase